MEYLTTNFHYLDLFKQKITPVAVKINTKGLFLEHSEMREEMEIPDDMDAVLAPQGACIPG